MASLTSSSHTRTVWGIGILFLTVAVQFDALYADKAPGPSLFEGADKIAHAVIFGTPVLVCVLVGLRPHVALALSIAHAPTSELIQHFFLPGRSGDPWDVVADLVGISLFWLLGQWLRGRVRRRTRVDESRRGPLR